MKRKQGMKEWTGAVLLDKLGSLKGKVLSLQKQKYHFKKSSYNPCMLQNYQIYPLHQFLISHCVSIAINKLEDNATFFNWVIQLFRLSAAFWTLL